MVPRYLQLADVHEYATKGLLVKAPGSTCDEIWTTWPDIQEMGLAGGNALIFRVFPSVGNVFMVLDSAISVKQALALFLR